MKLANVAYLARYYLRTKFLRDKRPVLGGIKLTHRCNLACKACPYWRRHGEELSFQEVQEIMDMFYLNGVRLLIFEGGEPFLWKDGPYTLVDLIEIARGKFFNVGVTTNGTLSLELPGSDILWVSIDGLRQTHDLLRGKSYDRILENLRKSSHPNIYANITINQLNLDEISPLVKELSNLVKGITIQFFFPYPESENLQVTRQERHLILDQLMKLKSEGYPIADSYSALRALKDNKWQCESWMLINADPDGNINHGCYLLNRSPETRPCSLCGFAAHTEISLAYQLNWEAIMAGQRILKIF